MRTFRLRLSTQNDHLVLSSDLLERGLRVNIDRLKIGDFPITSETYSRLGILLSNETKYIVGVHEGCGSPFNFRVATAYKALFCPGCGFRLTFPRSINTYGDLRQHLVPLLRHKL